MTTTLQTTAEAPVEVLSGPLFLPGLVGFIFAARACLTVLWFQDEPQQGAIVSVATSLVLLTVVVLFTLGSKPSLPGRCFRNPVLLCIAAFLSANLASLLWTSAPLDGAASYLGAWIADVITIWFLLRSGDAELQSEAVMKGYVWGACVVSIVAWSLPPLPDLRLGDEVFFHPNNIGFICATAALIGIHLAHRNKNWRWPALFLVLTLIRTISKTSIIAFFVATIFYLFRDKTLTRSAKIWIGVTGGALVGSLSGLLISYFNTYAETTNPETLTGRTIIWGIAGSLALDNPILGHGFYSLRFLIPPIGTFEAQHAHNELLQQFFVLGAVGVSLLIGLYYVAFRQIRRSPPSNVKILASTLLLFALIRGLTDTQTFDISYPLWLMAMLSVLLSSIAPRATLEDEDTVPIEA